MEKRGKKRIHRRLSVRFGEDEPRYSGYTRDISTSGAFIVCGTLPPLGTRLRLQFLMDGDQWVSLEGIVRRLRRVPPELRHVQQAGFAISFLGAHPFERVDAIEKPAGTTSRQAPPQPPAEVEGVLEAHFASAAALQTAWQRELRIGGLMIESTQPAILDRRIRVRLCLDFAQLALELPARIVQVVDGPKRSVAVAFEDPPGLRRALAPYVAR